MLKPKEPKKLSTYRLSSMTREQIKTISAYEKVSEADVIEAALNYFLDEKYPAEIVEENGILRVFKRNPKLENQEKNAQKLNLIRSKLDDKAKPEDKPKSLREKSVSVVERIRQRKENTK